MDLNKKVPNPWANVQSATARASYENLPLDFKNLSLGPKPGTNGFGGSNNNRNRTNSRKKIRKNRRANKTRRYKK